MPRRNMLNGKERLISYLPYGGLIIGILLLFYPETGSLTTHNHLGHLLLSTFALLTLAYVLFRGKVSISNYFQALTIFTISLFVFTHVAPITQVAAYHHQLQSSNPHPCCMPQVSTVSPLITINPTSFTVIELSLPIITTYEYISSDKINNKSPPFLFS